MKIIVDAMGGDFAPLAPVKGALMAQEKYGVDIVLTGKTEEAERVTVTEPAIGGVTAPVVGETPVTAITEGKQFTGTVTWSPDLVDGKFGPQTVYTATITLTPKAGYKLDGVAANFFTVSGATSVSNEANSGVVTAVFPATKEAAT